MYNSKHYYLPVDIILKTMELTEKILYFLIYITN